MAKFWFGNEIYRDGDKWRYKDGTLAKWEDPRPCTKCGLNPKDFNHHDPCLADLPGVRAACCGHGVKKGYVQFTNGVTIKGDFVVRKDEIKWKPVWPKKMGKPD